MGPSPTEESGAHASADASQSQSHSLMDVMEDETVNETSPTKSKPAAEHKAREKQKKGEGSMGRAKRKMIIDEETQLSAEEFRAQLSNPSALVRNLAAEAAAANSSAHAGTAQVRSENRVEP